MGGGEGGREVGGGRERWGEGSKLQCAPYMITYPYCTCVGEVYMTSTVDGGILSTRTFPKGSCFLEWGTFFSLTKMTICYACMALLLQTA